MADNLENIKNRKLVERMFNKNNVPLTFKIIDLKEQREFLLDYVAMFARVKTDNIIKDKKYFDNIHPITLYQELKNYLER